MIQIRKSSAIVLNRDHSINFIGDCTLVAVAPAVATEAEADADAEADIEADADAKDWVAEADVNDAIELAVLAE